MSIIFYTGIGSNANGKHSAHEFVTIMNREFTNRDWSGFPPDHYQFEVDFKECSLPNDFIHFTLEDWVEYAGAEIRNNKDDGEKEGGKKGCDD
jgi:hypothetical protein